ncbi:MAG: YhdP family protein [Burkholderiaceae bacterium]|nr:YhdP family protein [Burkholderiaceae bacterium]
MNDLPLTPSRLLRGWAYAMRWLLWAVLAGWLLFTAAWGTLHGWIVPRIGEFRPQLEIQASRILGVQVRIGAITAQSAGMIPSFALHDVVLLDPEGRPALRLPRVEGALSPHSLWNLGFEQLYIDRPELDIRRDAAGRIFVAGLDFSKGGDNSRAADWFFSQTEFVIRNGTIRWTDEQRAAPPLVLGQVDFVSRNGSRRHALRLDASPPPEWGERFSVRARMRQPLLSLRDGKWADWDGQIYADFARVDVSRLRAYADLGIVLREGSGALRLWADVSRGQLVGGTADVALTEASATLGAQLQPLTLQTVVGRLGGRVRSDGFEFSTEGLQFTTDAGLRWPGGNLSLIYAGGVAAGGTGPEQGELRADRLDLAALTQIASRLPLGTATHEALADFAPKGLVESLQAKWQGPVVSAQKLEAKGRVTQLEFASHRGVAAPGAVSTREPVGRPGVRGVNVDFELTQLGGKAHLEVKDGVLDLPGVFEDPLLPLAQFSADAQWQVDGQRIAVDLSKVRMANADVQGGEAQLSWRTADVARTGGKVSRFPGVIDLQGSMSQADGARVHRYLPLTLPKGVRDYVRDAVPQAGLSQVKFRVKGDLRDMPFTNPKLGEFRISAQMNNALFIYVPRSIQPRDALPWPALSQLAGEIVFERNGMQLKGITARLSNSQGFQLSRGEGQIADFKSAVVAVGFDARGPLSDALGVVASSPLNGMTQQALARATASGQADYRLRLNIPISAVERSRVLGTVTLGGNDVQISPGTPVLARARGQVIFSESGFSVPAVQARIFGGDARIEGGSRATGQAASEPAVVLRAQGVASAEGLRQARDLGFLARMAGHASGSAAYAATLSIRRGTPEIVVTSNLQGMALNLPQPLSKAADTSLAMRYENMLLGESLQAPSVPAQAPRLQDRIALELGSLASVFYVRDLGEAEPRVLRGGIGVGLPAGESLQVPAEGVAAHINFAAVDLDAWEDVLSRAAGTPLGQTQLSVSPPPRPGARNAPASAAMSYVPDTISVRARELTVQGRKLHEVVVGGSREGNVWRANLDATELNGYVEYRPPVGANAGRLRARLSRLSINPSAASEVEALLVDQPANLPALDIVVDELELRGKQLGRVEIDAVNRGANVVAREGGARGWHLSKLNLTLPEAAFSATGNWNTLDADAPVSTASARALAARRRTVMSFRLDISDSGELLKRFGMPGVLRRGKGRMEGQVGWTGSPLSLDYPSLSGQFNINMESGQFLKADPGLAKLLGVLSLQSLPRRLALDFRDVFSEGFAFDFVRGDVRIDHGIAVTNNLQMKGVNAAVLMDGRADIARETQDIQVVVVPEIDAGTASLVAGVINPAIGLGTFLAQMFLRRPLIEAATQEFHIDGTWADPRITRLPRRTGAERKAESDRKSEAAAGGRP